MKNLLFQVCPNNALLLTEEGWQELKNVGKKIADAVVITTQDRMHAEPAIALSQM